MVAALVAAPGAQHGSPHLRRRRSRLRVHPDARPVDGRATLAGKPAAKSLHDTAIDLREQATKLLQRAEFIERAATVLEKA
jgi:hypothetical protein